MKAFDHAAPTTSDLPALRRGMQHDKNPLPLRVSILSTIHPQDACIEAWRQEHPLRLLLLLLLLEDASSEESQMRSVRGRPTR
jgi:hypothetical protein